MSIDALTQAKSTLEGVRGALGIFSKTEVDMTLGMLDRAIAKYTDLDAICQDLQEKTYTQSVRIAELEAKLAEKQEHGEPVAWQDTAKHDELVASEDWDNIDPQWHWMYRPLYTHPQPKREWVGLTVMEAVELDIATNHPREFAAAIEAKLKDKNGF